MGLALASIGAIETLAAAIGNPSAASRTFPVIAIADVSEAASGEIVGRNNINAAAIAECDKNEGTVAMFVTGLGEAPP